jgi:hypothetical protein
VTPSERRRRILLGTLFIAIVAAGFLFFLPGPGPRDMLACLPPGDGPTLFIDVALLRRTGALSLLGFDAAPQEPDYLRFVQSTGFDWRRHLDRAALQFRGDDRFLVVSGRFDRARLASYAASAGGRCAGQICTLQGSAPDRQISFLPLRRNLLAVATSRDPLAAALLSWRASTPGFDPPSTPLWLHLPGSFLQPREGLPPGFSAFLSAMQGASRAIITLELGPSGFEVALAAPCPDPGKARSIAAKLTSSTELLKKLIAREGKIPAPTEPAAILSSGAFRADGATARGRWPLPPNFLQSLAR